MRKKKGAVAIMACKCACDQKEIANAINNLANAINALAYATAQPYEEESEPKSFEGRYL
jgi:hypothetical protein